MQVAPYYRRLEQAHKLLCQATGELSGALVKRTITRRTINRSIENIGTALELLNHEDNLV